MFLSGILLVVTLIGGRSPAYAHIPEPFTFELELSPESIVDYIQIQDKIWLRWFGEEARLLPDLSEPEREALKTRIQSFLVEHGELSIDRVPVVPVIDEIEFQEGFEVNDFLDYVAITATYPVKGRPRQVSVRWLRFDENDNWNLPRVLVPFRIYEDDIKILELTETEPQYIWHAPAEAPPPPKPFVPPAPPQITVPLVSAGLMILLFLLGVGFYFTSIQRMVAWGIVGVVTVASIGFAPSFHRDVELSWLKESPRPDEEEARFIFEGLHRNIYRAFDYDSESEVYDALAQSVASGLIDSVYNEVYQSLIMREAEGAVCDVRAVDRLVIGDNN